MYELEHEADGGYVSDIVKANNWMSGILNGWNGQDGFLLDQINACHPYWVFDTGKRHYHIYFRFNEGRRTLNKQTDIAI